MNTSKQVQLRTGDAVWATLTEDDDGTKTLEIDPDLTELQISTYTGGLAPYDREGIPLRIEQGIENAVCLKDLNAKTRMMLRLDAKGEISDVAHPLVALVLMLAGGGSQGTEPIQAGELLFRFRWK